jgi:hypothetical protein
MKFQRNIGGIDRFLRYGISVVMIYFGFFSRYLISDPAAGIVLGVFGILGLVIATIGVCPLYSFIGFSTAHRHRKTTDSR